MLYPFKKIKDIPAYDSITGTELIDNLRHNLTDTLFLLTIKLKMSLNKKTALLSMI